MKSKKQLKSEALEYYLDALKISIEIPYPPFNASKPEFDAWQKRIQAAKAEVVRTEKIWKEL